jgi:membrane-bound metal-dependent hydrolase YbcI (DUF457 family)
MPLPIAHGLLGATVVAVVHEPAVARRGWPLLLGALLALGPDVDFLFGAHRSYTHSLAVALLLTGVLLALGGRAGARAAVAYGLAFMSHGVLDFATTLHGRGVKLLWPVSDAWFKLDVLSFSEFYGSFPLRQVLERSLVEAVVFTPLLLLALFLRLRTRAGYTDGTALERGPGA